MCASCAEESLIFLDTMKTILKKIGIVLGVFVVGGLGGMFLDRTLVPYLSTVSWVVESGFFDNSIERTTVVQKTEQVVVREDDSVEGVIAKPSHSLVTLLYPVSGSGKKDVPAEKLTGILLTNDNILVTYKESARTAPTPRARLHDGTILETEFVGEDDVTNLAFYRLQQADNTQAMELANSDDFPVGKKLVALKNARLADQSEIFPTVVAGFDETYSLASSGAQSEKWEGVMRLGSALPDGFQGAPVISYAGGMVGIVGHATNAEGIRATFALPSNTVQKSLERVIAKTVDESASLGVTYVALSPDQEKQETTLRTDGARITGFVSSTNSKGQSQDAVAKKLSMVVGDVIVSVDGVNIDLAHPLPSLLFAKKRGDQVSIVFEHLGTLKTVETNFSE